MPQRRPIPGKIEQARSRGLLKEAFAAQLKDRSSAGRKKLAQALLDEVPKTADNPVDQFVLVGGAIDASKEAAVLRLCFSAADQMAAAFDVDGLTVKAEAVLKVNLRGDSPATAAENGRAALELIDPLVAAEDFPTAAKILALSRPVAAGDPALPPVVQKRTQAVESLRIAHDRMVQQLEKLKMSPDDPQANLAVGSYLCLNKGEREKGLPLLTKGYDANLKQLAALELSKPTTADGVSGLGDRWWEVGEKQPDAIRARIHQHAASFYTSAIKSATGLRHTVLERRIADAGVDQTVPLTGSAAPQRASGFFTNLIGMKFVRIKPGIFMMGSPEDEPAHRGDESQHQVTLSHSFYIGIHLVTRKQFGAFVADTGYKTDAEKANELVRWRTPGFEQQDDHPVVGMSWNDAVAFTQWLSQRESRTYRLPTEAEWEYACRATTTTAFNTGTTITTDLANYNRNRGKTTTVGSFAPNAWGLYDMHGNAWQWCFDVYGRYAGNAVTDPTGPEQSKTAPRVRRGGCWDGDPAFSRSAFRGWNKPDGRSNNFGFRVVLDSPTLTR